MNFSDINPYLRTVGRFEWKYHNEISHVSCDFRMFAVTQNPAFLLLRGKTKVLEPGTLVILAPGEPYRFNNIKDEEPFLMYCLSFDLTQEDRGSMGYHLPIAEQQFDPDEIIDQKFRRGERDIAELGLPLVLGGCQKQCRQVHEIYDLHEGHALYYPERCSGMIKDILFSTLASEQGADLQSTDSAESLHSAEVARKTMEYIHAHFSDPISEEDIAAVFNYHPYYLARLTMRYYHTTPYRYLIRCRVEEAIRLLTETELPIHEISTSCGFVNPSHFSTVIRRSAGTSPKEIRQNRRLN